ncbi:MAG: T9SS type A sorting domain-containing protein [Candidatus Cloacimonadota bacterium]
MILIVCLLLTMGGLWAQAAIGYLPGSGEQIQAQRDYSFFYHGNTEDLHWYGSPQWAVLFDFDEVYPTLSLSQFAIESAQIYFPVTGHNAKVELFTDYQGQPQQRVGVSEQIVTQNLMQFDFETTIQTEKIWVILSYNASYQGPFVAASWGGGTHSYYLNQNFDVPFFQNMANAGFNCEFLFGVKGEFLIPNQDLELKSFELSGDKNPRSNLRPQFTIYNHSSQTISAAQVQIQISSPSAADFSLADNIPIMESIPPQTEYVFNPLLPAYSSYVFNLAQEPMQIKAKAILSSELSEQDTLFNNSKTQYYNIFDQINPVYLVENFIRNDELDQIRQAQQDHFFDGLHSLYYYPILSDSLSSLGSARRHQWYSLFSTPVTILGGQEMIFGYGSSYEDSFVDKLSYFDSDWTFISSSSCTFTLPAQGENLQIELNLTNGATYLFNSAIDPNLMTDSRLFAAFFRKDAGSDDGVYRFERWIAFGDTVSAAFAPGQSLRKNYTTSLSNLDLVDLGENFRLYYWLQATGGGKVHYSAFSQVSSYLSGESDHVVSVRSRIYPNPLRASETLQMDPDSKYLNWNLELFNLRGQKIYHSQNRIGKTELDSALFERSGIYFVRISGRDSFGNSLVETRKITVFK